MGNSVSPYIRRFSTEHFNNFENQNKKVIDSIKRCKIDDNGEDIKRQFLDVANADKVMLSIYVAKYTPEYLSQNISAVETIKDQINWYFVGDQIKGIIDEGDLNRLSKYEEERTVILDGLCNFLAENKAVYKKITDLIQSWDESRCDWKHERAKPLDFNNI